MLINKENVERYAQTFTIDAIESVLQWLEVFGCCQELYEQVFLLSKEPDIPSDKSTARERSNKRYAEQARKIKNETQRDKEERECQAPQVVIGMCPNCNSTLQGHPIPSCEQKKSGRVFYAECSACKYYYEMFQNKRTKKYRKVEGG